MTRDEKYIWVISATGEEICMNGANWLTTDEFDELSEEQRDGVNASMKRATEWAATEAARQFVDAMTQSVKGVYDSGFRLGFSMGCGLMTVVGFIVMAIVR